MTSRKPRILFAWELGANFGHASNVAEVARALGDRADVTVAAKDPVDFRRIAPDLKVDLLPAPLGHQRPPRSAAEFSVSYPDDLRHVGWAEADELSALLESWSALIRLTKPDLIVAQAAPTATLAARGLDIPGAMFGYGYDCPPRATPMPPFFFWSKGAGADAPAREAQVVETANVALARLGRLPVADFAEIFRSTRYFISSFAEMDAYAPRSQFEAERPQYYGQLATRNVGEAVDWRPGTAQRLFAYVRAANASARLALEAVAGLPPSWDVIVAAPGLPADAAKPFAKPHVRLIDGPARLDRLLPDCDVGLSHGSNGIAAVFLAAGLPQVCLPNHAEQMMCARALGVAGVAFGLAGNYGAAHVRDAVVKAAADPGMRQRAETIAKRLKRDDLLRPAERIADGLMALV